MACEIHGLSVVCNLVDFRGKKMSIAELRVVVRESVRLLAEGWTTSANQLAPQIQRPKASRGP